MLAVLFLGGCLADQSDPRLPLKEQLHRLFQFFEANVDIDNLSQYEEPYSLNLTAAEVYKLALTRLGYSDYGAQVAASWLISNLEVPLDGSPRKDPYFHKLYLEYQTTGNIWYLSKYYYGVLFCTLDSDNLLEVYEESRFFDEFAAQNIFLYENGILEHSILKITYAACTVI